jgi:hypothetical protein
VIDRVPAGRSGTTGPAPPLVGIDRIEHGGEFTFALFVRAAVGVVEHPHEGDGLSDPLQADPVRLHGQEGAFEFSSISRISRSAGTPPGSRLPLAKNSVGVPVIRSLRPSSLTLAIGLSQAPLLSGALP